MTWLLENKAPGSYPMTSRARRVAEKSEREKIAEEHARLRAEFVARVRAGRTPFPREAVA